MNLENLEVALAQRSSWQAIDLGMKVAQKHYKQLLAISSIMVAVLSLLLFAITQDAILTSILLFWFKPIIERPILFYLSRAIFGDAPTLVTTLKQLRSVVGRQWLKTYTLRRFNPSRSFNESVVLLEGLDGKARSSRLDVLHKDGSGAIWLTMFGIHVEMLIQVSLFMLPLILLPESVIDIDWEALVNIDNDLTDTLSLMAYAVGVILVAPFYVACGFMLYLNRRTHLEAWDIELGFKKIVQRLGSSVSMLMIGSLLFVGLTIYGDKTWASERSDIGVQTPTTNSIAGTGIIPGEAIFAENEEPKPAYPELTSEAAVQTRATLDEILASDVFGERYQDESYSLDWDWDFDWEPSEETEAPDLAWLSAIQSVALYFKYVVLLLLVLLMLYVLIKYRVWELLPSFKSFKRPPKPDAVLGFNVKKDSLPSNVRHEIERYLKEKAYREALSLMFRAHVIKAIHVNRVPFKQSSTEQECVSLMLAFSDEDESQCFGQLIRHWQLLAYAHEHPAEDELKIFLSVWYPYVSEYLEK